MVKSEPNKCIVFVKIDEVWHVTNVGGTRWHPCEEQMPPTSIGRIRAAATECQAWRLGTILFQWIVRPLQVISCYQVNSIVLVDTGIYF